MQLIGILATILTTVCCVPTIVKIWKSKRTDGLSIWQLISLEIGIFLWAIYAMNIGDNLLVTANVIALMLNSILIYLKIKYWS